VCGNTQNNFGPQKAPRLTWHIWTSQFASCPSLNITVRVMSLAEHHLSRHAPRWTSPFASCLSLKYHRSCHAPRWTHATPPFRGIAAWPVLIVTCVQSSDVSIWFWDTRRARFTRKTSRCIEENCSALSGVEQQILNCENSQLLHSTWWKCFLPLPKKLYSAAC